MYHPFAHFLLFYAFVVQAQMNPCIQIINDQNASEFFAFLNARLGELGSFSIDYCNETDGNILARDVSEEADNFFIMPGFKKFAGRYVIGNLTNQSIEANITQLAFQEANAAIPEVVDTKTDRSATQAGFAALLLVSSALWHEIYWKALLLEPAPMYWRGMQIPHIINSGLILLSSMRLSSITMFNKEYRSWVHQAQLQANLSLVNKVQNKLAWNYVLLMFTSFEVITSYSLEICAWRNQVLGSHRLWILRFSLGLPSFAAYLHQHGEYIDRKKTEINVLLFVLEFTAWYLLFVLR